MSAKSFGSRLVISTLTEVEVRSVFAIKVRSGVLTRAEGSFLMQQFRTDIAFGRFEISPASDTRFHDAGMLLERYGFDFRLRTLDALQLAIAVHLKNEGRLDYLVAADKVLCEVAAHEGIAVINPEQA